MYPPDAIQFLRLLVLAAIMITVGRMARVVVEAYSYYERFGPP